MVKKTALKKLRYGDEFKIKNWKCSIDKEITKGDLIFCVSKKGKLASIFSDETVRFSTHRDQVKIDGKKLEDQMGVELS